MSIAPATLKRPLHSEVNPRPHKQMRCDKVSSLKRTRPPDPNSEEPDPRPSQRICWSYLPLKERVAEHYRHANVTLREAHFAWRAHNHGNAAHPAN